MISVPASESQLKENQPGVSGKRLHQLNLGLILAYWISAKSSKNTFHSHWRKIWFTQFLTWVLNRESTSYHIMSLTLPRDFPLLAPCIPAMGSQGDWCLWAATGCSWFFALMTRNNSEKQLKKHCHPTAKKQPVNLSHVSFSMLTTSQGQDVLSVYRRSLMNGELLRHAELQIAALTDLIRTCSI